MTRDEERFNELYATYQGQVLGQSYVLVPEDAEDVAQEMWLRVWQRLSALDHRVGGWLRVATAHYCTDLLRSRQRHPTSSFEDLPDVADGTSLEEAAEDRERLRTGLLALSPEQRAYLVRVTTADRRWSVSEAKSMLHYARICMKQALEEKLC